MEASNKKDSKKSKSEEKYNLKAELIKLGFAIYKLIELMIELF
jgi:hypothetical protein